MNIAVLSGKGGAGKTFTAVNLARAAGKSCYIDCDVEEPNGHLFLKPGDVQSERVSVMSPKFDAIKCTACKECADFCKYNSIAVVRERVLHFKEVCHSCGGCILICPEEAALYSTREIGDIREGESDGVRVLTGVLDPGEVSGVPIVREMQSRISLDGFNVIDCPPGTSCLVMESIRKADFCVLVAEPTAFGAHDLAMALKLVRLFKKPAGVVLNKCLPEENPASDFCMAKGLGILCEIPYDSETAKLISNGEIAVEKQPFLKALFAKILSEIKKEMLI